MRVLITGAAGLVGSQLGAAYGEEDVVALRHRDLDITDASAVAEMVQRLRPELLLNCAVIGVDDCEADPSRAERVNVDGPRHLAEAMAGVGGKIVHFSSNYVFDGERVPRLHAIPYSITDEPRPINVYGETKLRGERAVVQAAPQAYIVRTSWVFGPGKNSFLSTAADRLSRGERIQAISDTYASTTYVNDLVTRVLEIVERGHAGTYHVVNDGVCSYESFAREAARLAGADAGGIDTVTEASLARPARRPRWTAMRCTLSEQLGLTPMRSWEDALAEYVRR